ncbi:hypothetical protein LSAT2_003332 [Lamellibrachia satsuma]|nr:hypothetical protein LSAT2_003332 [Lamellibrachia satsuma]
MPQNEGHNCAESCFGCHASGAGKCDVGHCKISEAVHPLTKICAPCGANCKKCDINGIGSCDVCSDGFTLKTSDKTCLRCSAWCRKCDSEGAGNCDKNKCMSGYTFVETDATCHACLENCLECDENGPGSCDKCKLGYLFYEPDNKCQDGCVMFTTWFDGKCFACSSSCKVCYKVENIDEPICLDSVCKRGYVLTADGLCEPCAPGCAFCAVKDGATTCYLNTCLETYAQVINNHCLACPEGCNRCSLNKTDNSLVCSPGSCSYGYMQLPGETACSNDSLLYRRIKDHQDQALLQQDLNSLEEWEHT